MAAVKLAPLVTTIIGVEEFPLDNIYGTEVLSVEYEISKTVSNEVSLGTNIEGGGKIGGDLLVLLKAELSIKISQQVGQKIGEVITHRHAIRFTVKPGHTVTYIVVWKRRIRKGECVALINGNRTFVPYEVHYDLSHEIKSQ